MYVYAAFDFVSCRLSALQAVDVEGGDMYCGFDHEPHQGTVAHIETSLTDNFNEVLSAKKRHQLNIYLQWPVRKGGGGQTQSSRFL